MTQNSLSTENLDANSTLAGDDNVKPTPSQLQWLEMGLDQPGGKLPLFDRDGQEIHRKTIESCVAKGWASPWFANPIKPNWLVCRLTDSGRKIIESGID